MSYRNKTAFLVCLSGAIVSSLAMHAPDDELNDSSQLTTRSSSSDAHWAELEKRSLRSLSSDTARTQDSDYGVARASGSDRYTKDSDAGSDMASPREISDFDFQGADDIRDLVYERSWKNDPDQEKRFVTDLVKNSIPDLPKLDGYNLSRELFKYFDDEISQSVSTLDAEIIMRQFMSNFMEYFVRNPSNIELVEPVEPFPAKINEIINTFRMQQNMEALIERLQELHLSYEEENFMIEHVRNLHGAITDNPVDLFNWSKTFLTNTAQLSRTEIEDLMNWSAGKEKGSSSAKPDPVGSREIATQTDQQSVSSSEIAAQADLPATRSIGLLSKTNQLRALKFFSYMLQAGIYGYGAYKAGVMASPDSAPAGSGVSVANNPITSAVQTPPVSSAPISSVVGNSFAKPNTSGLGLEGMRRSSNGFVQEPLQGSGNYGSMLRRMLNPH